MKHFALMLLYAGSILFGTLSPLHGASQPNPVDAPGVLPGMQSETVPDKDGFYVTSGYVELSGNRDRAESILCGFSRYREWMLSGMDGTGNEKRKLLVYVVDARYNPTDSELNTFVVLSFLKGIGKNTSEVPFVCTELLDTNGRLTGVSATLKKKNLVLNQAVYTIHLSEKDGLLRFDYEARVKLNAFVDIFFTLNTYRNTLEWYLERILVNFRSEMERT